MRCETCRYNNTELHIYSQCHDCDGYKNYQPDRDTEERLDYEESMANDQNSG